MAEENKEKCEICGIVPRRYDAGTELVDAILEGNLTRICRKCAEVHEIVPITMPNPNKFIDPLYSVRMKKEIFKRQQEMSEFGRMLRRTREKARLKLSQVAESIAEKEEDIKAVENGSLENKRVLNKLKQFLLVNLRKDGKTALEAVRQTTFLNIKEVTVNDLMKMGEKPQIQLVQKAPPAPTSVLIPEDKKENIFSKIMGFFVKKIVNAQPIEESPKKTEDIDNAQGDSVSGQKIEEPKKENTNINN